MGTVHHTTYDLKTAAVTFALSGLLFTLPATPISKDFKDIDQGSIEQHAWDTPESSTFSISDLTSLTESQQMEILLDFARNLVNNSIDIEPEMVKMVDEKFWDLLL